MTLSPLLGDERRRKLAAARQARRGAVCLDAQTEIPAEGERAGWLYLDVRGCVQSTRRSRRSESITLLECCGTANPAGGGCCTASHASPCRCLSELQRQGAAAPARQTNPRFASPRLVLAPFARVRPPAVSQVPKRECCPPPSPPPPLLLLPSRSSRSVPRPSLRKPKSRRPSVSRTQPQFYPRDHDS